MSGGERAVPSAEKDAHAVTSMPDRFYCTCGYGMTGPKRTVRGLRTHVLRANSAEAGKRARQTRITPPEPTEVWECGPHTNAWNGHDARCRRVFPPGGSDE